MSRKIAYDDMLFNKPATDRVKRLREEVINAMPIVCSERAKLVTESYRETVDKPLPIRRALALEKILRNISLRIWPDELIVGNHGSNGRRSAPIYPEYATKWLEEELEGSLQSREQDRFIVPEDVKADLLECFKYWENSNVFSYYRAMLPPETRKARDAYMFSRDLFERNGYGHTAYDIPKLLKVGLKGIRDEAKTRRAALDLTTPEGLQSDIFYQAVVICCDGVSAYIRRFAALALEMSESETDEKRKGELKMLAEVCENISENPARNMWDALQLIQFMQLVIQIETNGDSVSPGRMDQYLIGLYRNDFSSGTFTQEFMQELLDCFWIKVNEIVKVQDTESIYIHPGFPMTPNLTIGGQTPEGQDAVNELSYMMLNSQAHVRLTNPQFTVRVFEGTPNDFMQRVVDIIKLGTGMPALFGDKTCMEAIRFRVPDLPMERVRDFRIVGCVELSPRGFQGRVNGGQLNIARVVDLALNNGIDRLTGTRLGLRTGDASGYQSFDEFFEAVKLQMEYFVKHQVINAAVVDMVQRENTPHIFLSALIEGCLEKGKDMTWGGSLWGATPILQVGVATAADSLTAIKKLVFDEKKISMERLNSALDANFEGEENRQIRRMVLNAPKYGNDEDYADGVMRRMTQAFFDIVEKYKDVDGRGYTNMILTLGGTIPHGWKTGATADGRLAKTPISDSMAPTNGMDVNGPTAVLLSASKVPQEHLMQGNILNIKFTKGLFDNYEDKQKLIDMVTTYFDKLNGQEVQFNVVDAAQLKDAQEHPENYKDLIIRVAGYSARFVELSRELQNDIISRTEQKGI